MIQFDGSFDAIRVNLFLLFVLVSSISACGGDEVIESQVEVTPEAPPPVAREWYPSSKYQQQVPAYIPVPVMAQSARTGQAPQQPWVTHTPQPTMVAPPVAYQLQPQPQPYAQQPSAWSVPAPATVTRQPQMYWYQPAVQGQTQAQPQYYYQPAPRPWGNPTLPDDPQRPAVTTDAWPQGGYIVPWGTPSAGQPQVTPNYGYVW